MQNYGARGECTVVDIFSTIFWRDLEPIRTYSLHHAGKTTSFAQASLFTVPDVQF